MRETVAWHGRWTRRVCNYGRYKVSETVWDDGDGQQQQPRVARHHLAKPSFLVQVPGPKEYNYTLKKVEYALAENRVRDLS